jgi:hypothetical protein
MSTNTASELQSNPDGELSMSQILWYIARSLFTHSPMLAISVRPNAMDATCVTKPVGSSSILLSRTNRSRFHLGIIHCRTKVPRTESAGVINIIHIRVTRVAEKCVFQRAMSRINLSRTAFRNSGSSRQSPRL